MRSKNSPVGRTFADEARRKQLTQCAIEVIAEDGFAQASLARIAQRAGVAKSVVLYHFANKEELVEQVLTAVSTTSVEYVAARLKDATTNWDRIRLSIEGLAEFIDTHRSHALAGVETWNQSRSLPGRARLATADAARRAAAPAGLEEVFLAGQRDGEFVAFDPHVLAVMFTQATDAMGLEIAINPDLDLRAFAAELVAMFDRAIRRGS